MGSVIRKVCLYLPALITAFFAFRVWNAGHIMPAALLTTLCCTLAFVAIAVE
ncbi:TPA: hypothetical protein G8S40_001936 [Salmonella enterica]|uniref:Uncharacterized protein n=1 Tax=Salmonella enterica TaxID=28901 RepID=A0A757VRJ6_SALER|nr:hypothetical protein [Salmonella enterica]EEH4119157.1 hypothetical protein [Salmonella enterica subsp. enterica serovar Hvittingfoss]EIO3282520.1 hypothetical protein [Salmonella enterica]HAG0927955.1 hypothetical protein [Salmonella enterica]